MMNRQQTKTLTEGKVLGLAVAVVAALFFSWWGLVMLCYKKAPTLEAFGGVFEGVSALFAGLGCAGVAVSLWYQTKQIKDQQVEVKETTKTLQDQTAALNEQSRALHAHVEALMRPYMVARAHLEADTAIILIIENIGKTSANNLTLQLDRNYTERFHGGQGIQDLSSFRDPVKTFPPGMQLRYFLMFGDELQSDERSETQHPSRFEVRLSYEGPGNHQYHETVSLNLHNYDSNVLNGLDVGVQLKKVNEHLEKLTVNLSAISTAMERYRQESQKRS